MNNKEIAERIKLAREERNFTQKKVATYLGKKSSNAISEIERGNVNVTAEDIVRLADLFNKPIMYFFGQDYPDDISADFIALMEQLTPQEITEIKTLAQSNSEQKALLGDIQGDPNLLEDREIVFKIIEILNVSLKPLSNQITKALEIRKQLEELVGIKEYPTD